MLGFRAAVFPNRVTYGHLFLTGTKSIPISQIATVDDPFPGVQEVKIETTGGKVHSIVVRLRDKQTFINTVLAQMEKSR